MNQKYNAAFTKSRDLVMPAIDAIRNNLVPLVYVLILPSMLINFALPEILDDRLRLRQDTSDLWPLILLVGIIWSMLSVAALYYYQLHTLKGERLTAADAYRASLKYVVRLVLVSIATGIAVFFGLLFFIVPGFIFIRRYVLAPYYVVDRNLGVFAAMRTSSKETKPFKRSIWTLLGISMLVLLAGVLLTSVFGTKPPMSHVGEFFLIFFTAVVNYMVVFRYLQIKQASGKSQPAARAKAVVAKKAPAKKSAAKPVAKKAKATTKAK